MNIRAEMERDATYLPVMVMRRVVDNDRVINVLSNMMEFLDESQINSWGSTHAIRLLLETSIMPEVDR